MAELILPQTSITNGVGTVSGTVTLRSYNTSRQSILIQNLGTGILYVGGSAVSSSNGLQVLSGGDITLDKSKGASVYCYGNGTCDVRFLEEVI